MNKLQIALQSIGKTIDKNSPTILIGLGVSGLVGSTVMAVKATPKALELIDERELPPKELVVLCWRLYLPATVSTVLGTGAIILGNRLHLRRTAVLVSLYSLAENTLQTYQEKVIESVGKKKEAGIRGETSDAMVPTSLNEENIHNVGAGEELCYDLSSGRYFHSDVTQIRAAENEFNKELIVDNEKPLNELYYSLGLPAVSLGDSVGWDVADGLIEILINPKISTRGERPCLAIDFQRRPKPLWV